MSRPDDLSSDSQPPPVATVPLDDVCDSPRDPKPKESVVWPRAIVGGILGFVLVAFLLESLPRPRRPKADRTEAVSNARQINLGLEEFQREYGAYPGVETIGTVREQAGGDWELGGRTANDFFRQLLATGIMTGEGVFHAKVKGAKKGDGVITAKEALKKGECSFAYFPGARPDDSPNRPLIATPVIPGTDRFDPEPLQGKAVVLLLDGNVRVLNINKQGKAVFYGTTLLLDPANPAWSGHPVVIAWADL